VTVGVPEILIKGSKSLNIDIHRTRDDVLPYVVFDHEAISQSGVQTLDEFLKQRLPMNTVAQSNTQSAVSGSGSRIDLRGLGTNQTLVLVNGRRVADLQVNPSNAGDQSDLNGIPVGAVERIEVLPTSASGIYGGSATGGVVNIVLKKDFKG